MNEQPEALKKFSSQIEFALKNYTKHNLEISKYSNVLIGGLGGSGIGGRLTKNIFMDQFPLPIDCVAEYTIPAYVNEKTLCIIASYSGNTEETLQMLDEVLKRGCDMLILTSGGKIAELATQNNIKTYTIETGFQPRMALGFSLTYLIQIFAEFLNKDYSSTYETILINLKNTEQFEENALAIFEKIKPKINNKFIVVTDTFFEALGIRFAQQIQENAKHEAFVHVLPEANHNVIESYYGVVPSVFFFIDSGKNERVSARFEFLTNLLEVENHKVINLSVNEFGIESVYELIHSLDWLSLFVADFRNVDSLNVPNIASLKEFLENI